MREWLEETVASWSLEDRVRESPSGRVGRMGWGCETREHRAWGCSAMRADETDIGHLHLTFSKDGDELGK